MKRIISIILLSATLFANELEVDGGITATGEIQSPTIQALLEQIAQLQEQIALLQAQLNASQGAENQLETRLFEMPITWTQNSYPGHNFNLQELTGFELGNALISFHSVKNLESSDLEIEAFCSGSNLRLAVARANQENGLLNMLEGSMDFIYTDAFNYFIRTADGDGTPGSVTLVLSITAQFPSE